ncbi:MAG: rhodanese-like domain-containing protein [Flavobacteriales bacterium]
MKTIVTAALAVFSLLSCAQSGSGHLNPAEFKAAMAQPEAVVVDVRTPAEREQGYIEGSANIDWNSGTLLDKMSATDKDAPVLIYCASGGRSNMAMEALHKAGFTNVQDLAGGMRAWTADKHPILKP